MNVEQLVHKAKQVCDNRGARFTAVREKVFRLMAAKQGGVGAYDLLEELKLSEPGAKPATIYRALDFLSELGVIHKIESTNAFMLCHHFDHIHPVQLLICDECGNVDELHSSLISHELNNLASEKGFTVSNQTIEAHGKCNKCKD